MADQYDDGRYDPVRQDATYDPRYYPDESNSERTDRLADRFGFAETSIGYVPITAVRGGIKYPSKGNTMAQSVNQKLAALREKQLGLAREIAALERAIKRPAPPEDQAAWTIEVRFTEGGKFYNYLILRHGGRFYTTGTNVQDSVFHSWDSLLNWLDSAAGHSALIPLRADYAKTAPLEGRSS